MEKKYVMPEEMARAELDKWMDENDIIVSDDTRENISSDIDNVVYAIMRGDLVVEEDGTANYTVSKKTKGAAQGQKVAITEPSGNAFMEMGKKKDVSEMDRLVTVVCSMANVSRAWLADLAARDYKVLLSVCSLFMLAR